MGSCCFTNKNQVETTPLVTNAQNKSSLQSNRDEESEAERRLLEQQDKEPAVRAAVARGEARGVGKKRTLVHQREGPPEKAPTMCEEDRDQCDGVPLHLPADAVSNVATSSLLFTMIPTARAICIGGVSQKPQKCPYCDHEDGNIFFYLTMRHCSHQLLEKLYLAGWWRTGTICFKPDIRLVCCPNYSIRLEASKYIMSKSHRAIVRRFKTFLCDGDSRWKGDTPSTSLLPVSQGISKNDSLNKEVSIKKQKEKRPVRPGKGADPSKPPCRKAKEIRQEKWKEKQKLRGEAANTPPKQPQNPKTIEEILADADRSVPGQKHQFRQEILPCHPQSPKLIPLLPREYEIYCKFQDRIHAGKFKFHTYDEFVWGFVDSVVTNHTSSTNDVLLGTFHIHYYLDDELVMVTVADITPMLFISIYFFYDPDIRFIHPGIYTVIREIALTRKLQKVMPTLKYYILGYYNYSIPKISYKHQFRPTEIQCPDTYRWLPLEQVLSRIRENQYVRLSDDEYDPQINKNVDNLMVSLYSMSAMRYGSLPPNAQLKRDLLSKLVQEFGPYGISDEIILNLTSDINM